MNWQMVESHQDQNQPNLKNYDQEFYFYLHILLQLIRVIVLFVSLCIVLK